MTLRQRSSGRQDDQLRPYSIQWGIQPQADASVLMTTGSTQVICGVTIEQAVPPFLEGSDQGWITAEYGILPCATSSRYRREINGRAGRSMEIQRLIGRSLRMMVDLRALSGYTLRVDCDVLNADGGTRTASITGAALAVKAAIKKLVEAGKLQGMPELAPVAAISAGVVDGRVLLDLDYQEDSRATADSNFVMTAEAGWVEIQASAEGAVMTDEQFATMTRYAKKGVQELFSLWIADGC